MDRLSKTFAALADPTRRGILERLAEGEATVNELAEPFPITIQAVSRHLKVLEQAGLITRRRNAQRRPSRLETARLKEADEWVQTYRRLWERGFDQMEVRLRSQKQGRSRR
jgi:DNA-binding transcriptional ArsR family regulator